MTKWHGEIARDLVKFHDELTEWGIHPDLRDKLVLVLGQAMIAVAANPPVELRRPE